MRDKHFAEAPCNPQGRPWVDKAIRCYMSGRTPCMSGTMEGRITRSHAEPGS